MKTLVTFNESGPLPKSVELEHGRDELSFSAALVLLKRGYAVQRKGWNGKGMWIEKHRPAQKLFAEHIVMFTVDKVYVPWLASQTDLLAEDWQLFNGPFR